MLFFSWWMKKITRNCPHFLLVPSIPSFVGEIACPSNPSKDQVPCVEHRISISTDFLLGKSEAEKSHGVFPMKKIYGAFRSKFSSNEPIPWNHHCKSLTVRFCLKHLTENPREWPWITMNISENVSWSNPSLSPFFLGQRPLHLILYQK